MGAASQRLPSEPRPKITAFEFVIRDHVHQGQGRSITNGSAPVEMLAKVTAVCGDRGPGCHGGQGHIHCTGP